MHIAIAGCSGVVGPHLIQWLLVNSDATVVGCDSSYERLGELLRSERFAYYFADQPADAQLLLRLVGDADVLVDLRQIERTGGSARPDEIATRRAQRILAAACMEAGTRLVHVVPADLADVDGESGDVIESPGTETVVGGSTTVDPRGAPTPVTAARVATTTRSKALLGGENTPELIRRYGQPLDPQYIVVRLSHVLGDQLEVVPRPPLLSSLERLRDAILMSTDDRVELTADDLQQRTFLYVLDAASALGRIAIGRVPAFPTEPIQVGNPGFHLSTADVAREVLDVYKARYWDRRSPTPSLAVASAAAPTRDGAASLVDISQTHALLEWQPRWTLNRAIDDALPRLLAGQ